MPLLQTQSYILQHACSYTRIHIYKEISMHNQLLSSLQLKAHGDGGEWPEMRMLNVILGRHLMLRRRSKYMND